jgi:hypothetical protein
MTPVGCLHSVEIPAAIDHAREESSILSKSTDPVTLASPASNLTPNGVAFSVALAWSRSGNAPSVSRTYVLSDLSYRNFAFTSESRTSWHMA